MKEELWNAMLGVLAIAIIIAVFALLVKLFGMIVIAFVFFLGIFAFFGAEDCSRD